MSCPVESGTAYALKAFGLVLTSLGKNLARLNAMHAVMD
jgi:hypothetical protein